MAAMTDTDKLHEHAVEACKHLEQLATGIAGVGADEATVQGITKMAEMCRQVAKGLAQNMHAEEPPQPTTDDAIGAHMEQRRAAAAQPPA